MSGLFLEEFRVGQMFKHVMVRPVTESDNGLFSASELVGSGKRPALMHRKPED